MKNKVLVAGCGISGIGAARMLLAAGKSVILYDGNDKKNKEEIRAQVADNSSDETLSIVLGTLSQDVIDQSEYCVISPGIPTDLAFVEELKKMVCRFGVRSSLHTIMQRVRVLVSPEQMERQRRQR